VMQERFVGDPGVLVRHSGLYGEARAERPGAVADVAVGLKDSRQGIVLVAFCRVHLKLACLAVVVGHRGTRVSERRVYEIGRLSQRGTLGFAVGGAYICHFPRHHQQSARRK